MALHAAHRLASSRPDNVSAAERWLSLAAGLGMALAALRGGSLMRRAALGTAAFSLISRGATAYCPTKAALTGQESFGAGLREQWERVVGRVRSGTTQIDSLESMYLAELQELYSAETQLCSLLQRLSETIEHEPLRQHMNGYATEARTRREDLARILRDRGLDPREHPDQAMHALVRETWKMAQVPGGNLRDAALVASLQRLIHHMIAGYGTVAAYAKQLGHIDEAARFAECADRDQAIDQELTEVAKSTLNPDARLTPEAHPEPGERIRPH